MISPIIEIYSDGASARNPGFSGYGYVIRYYETAEGSDLPETKMIDGSQGYRLSTNNRMEILGGIMGLKTILSKVDDGSFAGINQINLTTDSEYFAKAVNQRWIEKWMQNNWMTSGFKGSQPKPVKNKDLWEQFIEVQNNIRNHGINLTMTHVMGHNGNELNERADKLAVAASQDNANYLVDEVYENSIQNYNHN